jgi:hypothetical protein
VICYLSSLREYELRLLHDENSTHSTKPSNQLA